MKHPKKSPPTPYLNSFKWQPLIKHLSAFIQLGTYPWRRYCNLLTTGDQCGNYAAIRRPNGDYNIPLQEDLIPPPLKRSKSDRLLADSRESKRKNESEF